MIEEIVLDMFNKINSFGTIVIISNSDKKWIMKTAKLFMPKLHNYINLNVPCFSAKNQFQDCYPNEPILWKAQVMRRIIKDFYDMSSKHNKKIISIGDSIVENIAFRSIIKLLQLKNVEIIKFIETPTINQLRSQLIKLNSEIENISGGKHLVSTFF